MLGHWLLPALGSGLELSHRLFWVSSLLTYLQALDLVSLFNSLSLSLSLPLTLSLYLSISNLSIYL